MRHFLIKTGIVSVLALCAVAALFGEALIDAGKLRLATELDRVMNKLDQHVATDRAAVAAAEPLVDFPEDAPIRAVARSIGLLWIDNTDAAGRTTSGACTAAVIAPAVLITNAHCVRSDGPNDKVVIEFWSQFYVRDNTHIVVSVETVPLEINDTLDYALLRLQPLPGQSMPMPLAKPLLRPALPNERLFMLYHTGSTPLVVTRTRCRATNEGRRHDLRHTCASRPGSSGSLVIAERDLAIVGLHRAIRRSDPRVPGVATTAGALADKSAILRKFMIPQAALATR